MALYKSISITSHAALRLFYIRGFFQLHTWRVVMIERACLRRPGPTGQEGKSATMTPKLGEIYDHLRYGWTVWCSSINRNPCTWLKELLTDMPIPTLSPTLDGLLWEGLNSFVDFAVGCQLLLVYPHVRLKVYRPRLTAFWQLISVCPRTRKPYRVSISHAFLPHGSFHALQPRTVYLLQIGILAWWWVTRCKYENILFVVDLHERFYFIIQVREISPYVLFFVLVKLHEPALVCFPSQYIRTADSSSTWAVCGRYAKTFWSHRFTVCYWWVLFCFFL